MSSLNSFLAYAEAQNLVLKTLDGIVMYHLTEAAIPEYIYFMPRRLPIGKSLSKFFNCQFKYIPEKFYLIYFNPIRWVLPNLAEVMREIEGVAVEYGHSKLLFQLTYGRITFDVTQCKKTNAKEDLSEFQIPIYLDEKNFFINVIDLPERMGIPKVFEKLDFTW